MGVYRIHDLQSQKRHRRGEVFHPSHLLHGGMEMFGFEGLPEILERKSSIGLMKEGISFFHLLYWCIASSLRLCFLGTCGP